jgi:E-phenylitaconyl-CoA hydratase
MLSARPFDAAQALALGLVNEVVDNSIQTSLDLARRLAAHDNRALQWTKRLLLADRKARLQRQLNLIDEARLDVMRPH